MTNGLSQEEINALLQGEEELGLADSSDLPGSPDGNAEDFGDLLSAEECDAMGEIGNIVMGTAATTLYSLLNHRVDITTPRVTVTTMRELARQYPIPFVAVEVEYTIGLKGTNVLFLKENDVKIITDLMMGGDGTNTSGDFTEMHLSCISEVMNQMVGSSSTSLSKMIGTPIDISPPKSMQIAFEDTRNTPFKNPDEPIVKTSFAMEVEGLISSEIMQVTPVSFAKDMVKRLMEMQNEEELIAPVQQSAAPAPVAQPVAVQQPPPAQPPMQQPPMQQPPAGQEYPAYPGYPPAGYYPTPQAPGYAAPQRPAADVRPVQFADFASGVSGMVPGENLDMLMDVPLSVSVELGKSRKFIRDILDFNIGTIVVLDKMAGDLVDVVVNGKLIAQGEVVVIDDNYGCRITNIVSPSKRIDPPK